MNDPSSKTRRRLEIPGFEKADRDLLVETASWLLLAFALCTALEALGTVLASPYLLWALIPIVASGAMSPVHPFDLIYRHAIRYLTGTAPLPERGAPDRFACEMGAIWMFFTVPAFLQRMECAGLSTGRNVDRNWLTNHYHQFLSSFIDLLVYFGVSIHFVTGRALVSIDAESIRKGSLVITITAGFLKLSGIISFKPSCHYLVVNPL